MDDAQDRTAVDQPPGAIPGRHHQLQPGAGRIARHRNASHPAGRAGNADAGVADRNLPGQRPGVPGLSAHCADPDYGGSIRRLPDPRHPLRELHPPADDPVDLAIGRSRSDRHTDVVRLRFQPGRHDRRVILLIGIVKKNGIMMVDFAIAAERDEHLPAEAAIRKAALLRFRPIMMTTLAALLGGVPLMLGTGTGSEIRQPLGYAMVGGLIVSQALTLFTTPVVYLYLDRLSDFFARWMQNKQRKETSAKMERLKDAAE